MPHIFIDGKKIETKPGKTIIEAAYDNGFQVPHFCWHPELSVAGNCRMCLVEVGMPKRLPDGSNEVDDNGNPVVTYFPKLQIACGTPITDGMYVNLNKPKVIEAQEAVMEFLLINHPLDCPICDEAGECKLQEYAFNHSSGKSRFEETKNHKDKRQKWGPNVMYDAERCISCSRCIRYAKEVAKQDVLTFVQRGDHVTIKLSEGTEFDNPYSMNVIEICPVGALTSPDFRFKSRVWDMSFNDSISFADSTGSNTKLGVRNNEILRVQPRTNMFINKYWLSDDARLNHYEFVNKNRISEPSIKVDGLNQVVSWQEAYQETAKRLGKFKSNEVFFLSSAKATNEDNYIFQKFARQIFKSSNIDFLTHIDKSFEDKFLGVADRTPNTNGAIETGAKSIEGSLKAADLAELIDSGRIKALFVMEEDFRNHEHIIGHLEKLDLLVVMYYNNNKITEIADIVLAASTYAEIEGTYTNKDKRVQHLTPALITKENLRFMGMKMSRLDKFGAFNDRWTQHEARNCKQSWRIIAGIANAMGAAWKYANSEAVFDEIVEKIPSFKYMSYDKLDLHQGLVLNRADRPDNVMHIYESHVMKPD
ncbi:MAG: molybdopterin-dependent oxidoreductase [Candidatus Kapabacteria bacterium]|nr:molybdopterin-dependent oxidoreductase [Ignavibacteriota bacterium]MCW5884773.1 molybdopterin-dependent oxidoreductase [Candidatus Kapabacteria bacterium]